jgi:hypothetical protein
MQAADAHGAEVGHYADCGGCGDRRCKSERRQQGGGSAAAARAGARRFTLGRPGGPIIAARCPERTTQPPLSACGWNRAKWAENQVRLIHVWNS